MKKIFRDFTLKNQVGPEISRSVLRRKETPGGGQPGYAVTPSIRIDKSWH